jgi:hypothetical protein
VPSRVRKATHERVDALRWDGRRLAADVRASGQQLLEATPEPVANGLRKAGETVRKLPTPVPIIGAIVLVLLLRRLLRHRD